MSAFDLVGLIYSSELRSPRLPPGSRHGGTGYIAMRELMRGTVLICQRSDRDRRRAMWMLHDIRDLSDHSSSDGSH